VEPRRRRRPGRRLHEHLPGDEAGLVLSRLSLPAYNWLRYPEDGGEPEPAWPLDDFLAGAAAAGFAAVGLDLFTLRGRVPGDLGRLLAERGLACSDVGVLAVGVPDVRERAAALAELASAAGAPVCIAAVPAPVDDAQAVAELSECAGIVGARLALEFASYGGLTELARAVSLCEAVGWDRCGVLVDSWHFFRTGAPWPALRALAGDRIALVHLNDGAAEPAADPVTESRHRRLPPGAGSFPLSAFLEALADTGYRGPLSAEVLSGELRGTPPAAGAATLLKALRSVRAGAAAS
jgi:sugar phosphate isomerase/epimerase